jgi:predicted house-cleaning noncanonical NTP pyrophosphatase (MazG superfamily)
MTGSALFSDDALVFHWSDTPHLSEQFGPKGAGLAVLPQPWTPGFVLLSAGLVQDITESPGKLSQLLRSSLSRVREIAEETGQLYVRSSVIGETIWDRGSFTSVVVRYHADTFSEDIVEAVDQVTKSARGRPIALVLQSYIQPRAGGEFGNVLRISKTRDHWELASEVAGRVSRTRLNSQRDEAWDPQSPLDVKGLTQERLFGSIAAWINNVLIRGTAHRVNCEWVATHNRVYLVQIDEETEDFTGVNPFQLTIPTIHQPAIGGGTYIRAADDGSISRWDKLKVLSELWEEGASHRPMLFYAELTALPPSGDEEGLARLVGDFHDLIGPDQIIVRTSVRAGAQKIPNLGRTEGLNPLTAAQWCLEQRDLSLEQGEELDGLAFVIHRFMAARAAAWVRADPNSPVVEIHSLWGLPDALQYCPYDIWEVHIPTFVATEYPDYKSNMMVAREDGSWEYVRVKNEIARSLSIGRREALDIARRTDEIGRRLDKPCHVMWFIGCRGPDGVDFSIPWYWTEAHEAERNLDRANYQLVRIADRADLEKFQSDDGPKTRLALELMPTDQSLMRDMSFIEAVGTAAMAASVPVFLAGSTLAHAYFALSRAGCVVIARGEKEHSRIRRNATFGKIVRDKIPARIARRKETGITVRVPGEFKKAFLTSKLLEEALEVRGADTPEEKRVELADLYEVLRALANTEQISMDDVVKAADEKREKSGGFDDGLVLMQTAILGRNKRGIPESEKHLTQVLARKIASDTFELPFTFFGFMELDQPRSLTFNAAGVRLHLTLKSDRLELRVTREAEQLELPLDFVVSGGGDE